MDQVAALPLKEHRGHILLYGNTSLDLDRCDAIEVDLRNVRLIFLYVGMSRNIILKEHPAIAKIQLQTDMDKILNHIHRQIIRFKLQQEAAFMDLYETINFMLKLREEEQEKSKLII